MKLGDTIEINGEIWVVTVDHSNKKHILWELWTKEGNRMAYAEVKYAL